MRARLRRRPVLLGLFVLLVVSGGASAGYAALGMSQVSADAVALEITARLAADDGTLHPGVAAVYQSRGGRPAWFAAQAQGAALRLLRHADRDGLPLDPRLEGLATHADTAAAAASLAGLDLALTDALLRHGDALGRPRVDAAELYGHDWTPAPPAPGDPAGELAARLAAHGDRGPSAGDVGRRAPAPAPRLPAPARGADPGTRA